MKREIDMIQVTQPTPKKRPPPLLYAFPFMDSFHPFISISLCLLCAQEFQIDEVTVLTSLT